VALNALRGPRLELVPASPGHLDFFARLNSDADVMRHISGRPSSRSETEAEWSGRLGRRSAEDRGLGYWTGYLDAQPIGWWGLGFNEPNPGEGELGFRVQREHWRQGLGLECTDEPLPGVLTYAITLDEWLARRAADPGRSSSA